VLNELLTLTRPLHVFDLETTSLDVEQARIVEIGFQTWTAEGLKHEWWSLVNPGVPILNSSNHHVTDDDVTLKCWKCKQYQGAHPLLDNLCDEWRAVPSFKQLAAKLAVGFTNCDFAGKNIRYDLQVLAKEMQRAGVTWSYADACIVDADRLEQIGEPRTLSHLYEKHTGKKLNDAHHALVDVRATVEIVAVQLQKYKQVLSRDLQQLHELQWPGWIDSEGKFRFDKEGVPRSAFGKHRGEAMKDIPQGYYKWLMGAGFSDEVGQLSADAIIGVFPKRGV
jgi:DNA polymerase III subunit epsilon